MPYQEYDVRLSAEHGFYYIVGPEGHLAHIPDGAGDIRAAFFDTREEADEAAEFLAC